MAIEMGFALPILLLFLLGTIQFGGYFVLHQEMARAAREATRSLALGELTESQAVSQVEQDLSGWNATFNVTATLDADATVLISVPYDDVALVSFINFPSGNLEARVTMRSEV